MRLDSLLAQGAVELDRGFVEPKFHDRDVRRSLLQKIAETKTRDLQLRMLEIIERIAEVQKQQVRLVSQHGEQRTLAGDVMLQLLQCRASLGGNLFSLSIGQLAPLRPAKTKHLVQHA